MNKVKCKKCGKREARFNEKRLMYVLCSPCIQELKSLNKTGKKTKISSQSNINEIYRFKLRILFLSELRKVKPKLFSFFENKLIRKYKNEFGTDFEDFQDVLHDKDYAKCFSNEFCEFSLLFIGWLNKWNLNDFWIVEFFLNRLAKKELQVDRFNLSEKMILVGNLPINATFLPPNFTFEFPCIESDLETEKAYRKRFDNAFKEARKNHFDLIKNAKSDSINFSVKQKHIHWLIDYHFEKKTFEAIAIQEQLTELGVSKEAVRKAVNQIANDLPFAIKN